MSSVDENHIERMVHRAFRSVWEEDRGGRITPPNLIYVTDVAQCLLKSWYQRTIGEPPSNEKIVILVLGDDVHYILSERFPIGEGEQSATKEYEGVLIRGRADRVLADSILEFKTVTRIPKAPYEHHVDQAQLYLWLFEKEKAYLIYVSKTDGKVKAFRVDKDQKRINELLEKAKQLSQSLKLGLRPAPEPGWLCKYCEYASICGAAGAAEEK
ncbi:MAG: hypothetical protein DRJ55_01050 [Thermoprotei archaeon]|mgnify:CR=1 FL=1|nr:MAG: hypothetical protein DRJ46_04150 [Thermoprotei archaeon]RLE95842.1 MAG: hypothetical protein DRJ55_01050 [Thermoprotei archaeon]